MRAAKLGKAIRAAWHFQSSNLPQSSYWSIRLSERRVEQTPSSLPPHSIFLTAGTAMPPKVMSNSSLLSGSPQFQHSTGPPRLTGLCYKKYSLVIF